MNKIQKTINGAVKNTYAYRSLLKQLVTRDLRLKYRRSILGYLWSVLNPLLTMLVMTIVFSQVFRFEIENYPVYLLCGSIIFGVFFSTTSNCCRAILDNAALIKKVYLPKYIFVLSRVTSGFVDFLFSFVALIFVLLFTNSKFSLYNFLFIIPCLEIYLFSLGIGLLLAQANVFFRDIQYLYSIFCTAINYLSVIFYPVEILPDPVRFFVENFNPIYLYITMFRDCVLLNVLINPNMVFRGLLWALGSIVIGIFCFKRNQDRFILFI